MAYGSGLTRGALPLTHRAIEALRPAEAAYRVPDQRCKGLAVRVAPSGLKTWDLAYRIRGTKKMRRISLGQTTDVSLEHARERAHALTSEARQGRDLIAEEEESRRVAAQEITVGRLIDDYLRQRVTGRLRTAKAIDNCLRRTLAPILDRKAGDIRRRDLRELIDPIARTGHRRAAEKNRQIIGAMFRWSLSQDKVETDPTAGLAAYDPGTPRDRVLNGEEIATLWRWLASDALPADIADALRLELLLGARCGEIAGMQAEEFDRLRWTWTLPASRSKNKRPRVTPIIGKAREIIAAHLGGVENGPLFAAERGGQMVATTVAAYLWEHRAKLPIAPFTSHDLRRTTATMMAEMGIALDLVAAVVGHEAGGRDTRTLVRHYVRSDLIERKANALTAWDARIETIVTGGDANVVQLRGTR
jgi:integrase